MTEITIALRTAVNILMDTVESGTMPSGMLLDATSLQLHERAAEVLKQLQLDLVES